MNKVLALAGNPNVGKSTLFNALTGLRQHTGNWTGKTVGSARGVCVWEEERYELVDLPGCYSLMAHSEEERVARDFICFENPDVVLVVCDATCIERNLNLALQIIEAASRVIVCVNLLDEAAKKNIYIDLNRLSAELKVPVVGITARAGEGLDQIFEKVELLTDGKGAEGPKPVAVRYPEAIEEAISILTPAVSGRLCGRIDLRWVCARLIDVDDSLLCAIEEHTGCSAWESRELGDALEEAHRRLKDRGYEKEQIKDIAASAFVRKAETISRKCVQFKDQFYDRGDRRLDRLFTSKITGFPIMFLLLMLVFWITIWGANIPSQIISGALFWLEGRLAEFAVWAGIPSGLYSPAIYGVYHVLAWVISVMLPPMAIFFPLFTLLEDYGYLPRVAFNLDHCFKKCRACGKQALTMCMGFGCNAVGVTGCRIIDSPRERLIAIITNNFVPCNGRYPTIISIISMFLIGSAAGLFSSLLSAALLAAVIILGVCTTLLVSYILSKTLLKGFPSSFALELPPYRRPQVGKVVVRSILDRTLFVLGRAVSVAAPAGLVIWLMANVTVGGTTILNHCSGFLDPFARWFGMDGVIFLAFILGMPANEIVMPIIIMAYLAKGSLLDISDISVMKTILTDNGWTFNTAVSTVLFSLMHWPCGTTCLTIHKETGSLKWTAVSIAVPTIVGLTVCFLFTLGTGYF